MSYSVITLRFNDQSHSISVPCFPSDIKKGFSSDNFGKSNMEIMQIVEFFSQLDVFDKAISANRFSA